jgi:hypothetical protein
MNSFDLAAMNSFASRCFLAVLLAASSSCSAARTPTLPLPAPLSAEADTAARKPCELAVRYGAAAGQHIYRESEVAEPAQSALVNGRGPKYPDERTEAVPAKFEVVVVVDSLGRADMETFRPVEPAPAKFLASVRDFLSTGTFKPGRVGGHSIAQCVKWTFQFAPTYYHRAGGH